MIDDLLEADVDATLAIDSSVREAQLREEFARPWSKIRAARRDGILIGYCLFWHVADELHLINIAVASSERRRGVGLSLMNDMLEYGRAHAITKVLLEVRAGNVPAISLYETQGFERLRVRKGYYDDGEDAVEMMLTIG